MIHQLIINWETNYLHAGNDPQSLNPCKKKNVKTTFGSCLKQMWKREKESKE